MPKRSLRTKRIRRNVRKNTLRRNTLRRKNIRRKIMKRKKTVRRNKYKGGMTPYTPGHEPGSALEELERKAPLPAMTLYSPSGKLGEQGHRALEGDEVASYNAKKLKDLKAAQAGLAKLEEKEDEGRKLGWRDKRRRKKWEEVEGV
jgi:hypothetical protein